MGWVWHRLGQPAFAPWLVGLDIVPLPPKDSDVIADCSNLNPQGRGSVDLRFMNLVQDAELRENLADAVGKVVGDWPCCLDGRPPWGMDVSYFGFVGHRFERLGVG